MCDPLYGDLRQAIFYNRASALAKMPGRSQEALADLDSALVIDPNYTKARLKRGDIFMQLNQFQEALNEFKKVESSEP